MFTLAHKWDKPPAYQNCGYSVMRVSNIGHFRGLESCMMLG